MTSVKIHDEMISKRFRFFWRCRGGLQALNSPLRLCSRKFGDKFNNASKM